METAQIRPVIEELSVNQTANAELRSLFVSSPEDSNAKLHAGLALLSEDESVLHYLGDRLLDVEPDQFDHVRRQLTPYASKLNDQFWQIAFDLEADESRRFRAACALAGFDPQNSNWQDQELGDSLAQYLVGVLPSHLAHWRDSLSGVKESLIGPLMSIYSDSEADAADKRSATDTLNSWLQHDPVRLFELICDATPDQFRTIFPSIARHRQRAIALAESLIGKTWAKSESEHVKEQIARRKSNACTLLYRLDVTNPIWPILEHSDDPRLRSYFIHGLAARDATPKALVDQFGKENSDGIRRALLSCLGEFEQNQFSEIDRRQLLDDLVRVYQNTGDPGLHSMTEWSLRKLQLNDLPVQGGELVAPTFDPSSQNGVRWFTNEQGQKFAILDGIEFQMGSPEWESRRASDEMIHRRSIARRFAISMTEVTRAQWRRFEEAQEGLVSSMPQKDLERYVQTENSPMISMSWYEAAWYCNWLSEKDGLPKDEWCYLPNDENKYGPGMKVKDHFLELTGYRLPTEAEWEYACRARASTKLSFGESQLLLPKYAWYLDNGNDRTHPVGLLRPNDFGLFDMHGNVYEWCYDRYEPYPVDVEVVLDTPLGGVALESDLRVLRGGAFLVQPMFLRCGYRFKYQGGRRSVFVGFRPARTMPDTSRIESN